MHAVVLVKGIIQGVGFRPFVYRTARRNDLRGFVRNRGDACVEIVVEGRRENVEQFITDLKEKKPPLAQVHDLAVSLSGDKGEFDCFTILKSFEGGDTSGSIIPPDVATCDACLNELRNPEDRRYEYFFITCTDCGPRYTIIERLPYDRPNTTMQSFPMCEECGREYADPLNRRFHAQTVACSKCGPKVFLTTNVGQEVEHPDPVREAGRLLEGGYIVAVKGNGGFHVASATVQSDPVLRLRKTKHRAQKPFAIMARDLEAVKSFAEVSREEAELLVSYISPIVLLKKSENYYLSEYISPGLHNVGVMLPYTGLHVMLFDGVKEPAFVMTSANPPNEPIIKENTEAIKQLGSVVDFFLLHDRSIAHRCDDSVVRFIDKTPSMVRRSRGYAPAPIHLVHPVKRCILGVGAEMNVTSCMLLGDKAFLSPHVGDVETLQTFEFLKESINHTLRLTNSRVEVVACDLHPKYITTRLAAELGEELGCDVTPVQHHHAHMASLMGEHGVEEMVGIACDGVGYGADGNVWGGEVLLCSLEGFQRLGHLEEQLMVGGDLATRHPLRMTASILADVGEVDGWLTAKASHFPHGVKEVELVLKQLKQGNGIKTTSCGRVLDAVSAMLGICYERTYEGEPAMKLESTALGGRESLNLRPKIDGKKVSTTTLLREIFDNLDRYPVRDLAFSAQSYLAKGLAQLAVEEAERLGVGVVGFSGGVAYNENITLTIRRVVEGRGIRFLTHEKVPPGDGGISFGQAVAASTLKG